MDSVVLFFSVATATFLLLLLLTSMERRRGRRFFAAGIRSWLDTVVGHVEVWFSDKWHHFTKYILQLHWYYSIHSVLRGFLKLTVTVYTGVENMFENNRRKAKRLRAERRDYATYSHLQEVADHKEANALTEVERQALKDKKLEESD